MSTFRKNLHPAPGPPTGSSRTADVHGSPTVRIIIPAYSVPPPQFSGFLAKFFVGAQKCRLGGQTSEAVALTPSPAPCLPPPASGAGDEIGRDAVALMIVHFKRRSRFSSPTSTFFENRL